MEKFIPLGSVVMLKGGVQKVLVISRAINVRNGDKDYFFDYGGVAYPEGLVGDQMAYFNEDKISKVIFEGYKDEENDHMVDNIRAYLEENPDIVKGDPSAWEIA